MSESFDDLFQRIESFLRTPRPSPDRKLWEAFEGALDRLSRQETAGPEAEVLRAADEMVRRYLPDLTLSEGDREQLVRSVAAFAAAFLSRGAADSPEPSGRGEEPAAAVVDTYHLWRPTIELYLDEEGHPVLDAEDGRVAGQVHFGWEGAAADIAAVLRGALGPGARVEAPPPTPAGPPLLEFFLECGALEILPQDDQGSEFRVALYGAGEGEAPPAAILHLAASDLAEFAEKAHRLVD